MIRGSSLEIYGRGLAQAATAAEDPYLAIGEDGDARSLPLRRWVERPSPEERRVLALAAAPVLDVGCGAGRHLAALRRLGVRAVGVEIAPGAVAIARRSGCTVLDCSIFAPIPGPGTWATALLLDGNIGIGGDPAVLLRRLSELIAPGGSVLIELEPPGSTSRSVRLRLEGGGRTSEWFPWAWVSADDAVELAEAAGFEPVRTWSEADRWFAQLDLVGRPALAVGNSWEAVCVEPQPSG